MTIVAVKGIEDYGDWWEVRYTRLTRRGAKQEASFVCETLEAAYEKSQELVAGAKLSISKLAP